MVLLEICEDGSAYPLSATIAKAPASREEKNKILHQDYHIIRSTLQLLTLINKFEIEIGGTVTDGMSLLFLVFVSHMEIDLNFDVVVLFFSFMISKRIVNNSVSAKPTF